MSTESTQWVIEVATVPGHLFAVLACLGWKADENGEGAYPSVPTLADWTGKTDRQVRSDLRALEAAALIRPGDQSLAAHIRADKRPTVWDLAMPDTAGSTRPEVSFRPEVHDRSSASARALDDRKPASVRDHARPEVERMHDRKPASANKSFKEKPLKTSRKREDYDDPAFGEFWLAYPRKIAKREAVTAWQAAMKREADPAAIVKAAIRFADERARQDPKFTPYPATWLNREQYDDECLPAAAAERDDDSWLR